MSICKTKEMKAIGRGSPKTQRLPQMCSLLIQFPLSPCSPSLVLSLPLLEQKAADSFQIWWRWIRVSSLITPNSVPFVMFTLLYKEWTVGLPITSTSSLLFNKWVSLFRQKPFSSALMFILSVKKNTASTTVQIWSFFFFFNISDFISSFVYCCFVLRGCNAKKTEGDSVPHLSFNMYRDFYSSLIFNM